MLANQVHKFLLIKWTDVQAFWIIFLSSNWLATLVNRFNNEIDEHFPIVHEHRHLKYDALNAIPMIEIMQHCIRTINTEMYISNANYVIAFNVIAIELRRKGSNQFKLQPLNTGSIVIKRWARWNVIVLVFQEDNWTVTASLQHHTFHSVFETVLWIQVNRFSILFRTTRIQLRTKYLPSDFNHAFVLLKYADNKCAHEQDLNWYSSAKKMTCDVTIQRKNDIDAYQIAYNSRITQYKNYSLFLRESKKC